MVLFIDDNNLLYGDTMQGKTRIRSLTGYPELVRQLGGVPKPLMSEFGIDIQQLDSDSFIPYASLTRLLEATAESLNCPDVGLRLGERLNLNTMGPLALLAQNSTTVGAAYLAVARNMAYFSEAAQLGIDADLFPNYKCLTFSATAEGCSQQRQTVEFAVTFIQNVIHMLSGGRSKPVQILFRHDANMPARLYRPWFSCPVRFQQSKNALVYSPRMLDESVDQANPEMLRVVEAYVESIIERQSTNVSAQVRVLVSDLLPTEQCKVKYIADKLNMHSRTLQRRLAGEGQTFDEIVDSTRRQRAQELLAQVNLSMAHITDLLGYAEQSTFNHACQRWFGCAPKEARHKGLKLPKQPAGAPTAVDGIREQLDG